MLKRLMLVVCAGWCMAAAYAGEEIKHRFILCDESRHALHYVDEKDPTKDWDVTTSGGLHDIQLIGNNRLLLSQGDGYVLYDLESHKAVETVKVPGLGGVMSLRRKADGTSVAGANQQGITVFEIDKANAITRKMSFPELRTLRMLRLAADGNVLLAEQDGLTEVAFDAAAPNGGKIVKRIKLPRASNAFLALKKSDGNYLCSGGYAHTLFEFGADGKVVREFDTKEMPQGLSSKFYSGFQGLSNGNFVACNWTGHGPQDSKLGWQIIEFAPDGKTVWKWHNAERSGTALNIIILDDLNTAVLNEDSDGVLGGK